MSNELVMPSEDLIICCPLSLLPSIFPVLEFFPMSHLFASDGRSIGDSASASILPMNIQGWFSLGLTGLILLTKRVFSSRLIQPFHPLSSLILLPPIPPSIRVFSNKSTLHKRWPKYWSFSFSNIPSKEIPGLISFRMDWLDLLAVQGTLKSLLQHQLKSINSSALSFLHSPILTSIHDHWKNHSLD